MPKHKVTISYITKKASESVNTDNIRSNLISTWAALKDTTTLEVKAEPIIEQKVWEVFYKDTDRDVGCLIFCAETAENAQVLFESCRLFKQILKIREVK